MSDVIIVIRNIPSLKEKKKHEKIIGSIAKIAEFQKISIEQFSKDWKDTFEGYNLTNYCLNEIEVQNLNEKLETRILRPKISKNLTLYHGSADKFNIVRPTSYNMGTN